MIYDNMMMYCKYIYSIYCDDAFIQIKQWISSFKKPSRQWLLSIIVL